jgi:hypothetical protein
MAARADRKASLLCDVALISLLVFTCSFLFGRNLNEQLALIMLTDEWINSLTGQPTDWITD